MSKKIQCRRAKLFLYSDRIVLSIEESLKEEFTKYLIKNLLEINEFPAIHDINISLNSKRLVLSRSMITIVLVPNNLKTHGIMTDEIKNFSFEFDFDTKTIIIDSS